MSSNQKSKIGPSYLLALFAVSFSRFAWLPWIVLYLHQRKYNSWSSTVSAYGLILSFFQIGQYIGHIVTKSKFLNASWFTVSFMTLTGSFMSLCFITRITFVLVLFMLMGFSGTVLSGVSINIDSNTTQMSFLKKSHALDINDHLDRNLACFAFVILIAGYLYDARPLSSLPMYSLAVFLALFCILVLVYFLLLTKVINAKSRKTGLTTSSYSGYGATNSVANNDMVSMPSSPTAEYVGPVPANFLSACSGNLVKAQAMYGKMLHWRKVKKVDDIFTTPQEHFHDILQYYPHAIHGYSLDGCAVVYEILGKGNMAKLKASGATIQQIVWHFALRNALVFERLLEPDYVRRNDGVVPDFTPSSDPNVLQAPVRRMMTVLDVGGISFSAVNSDVLSFIKQSGELIDNYYPEQVSRLVICNAPSWFSTIWRIISGALPESVQKKIDILYDSKGLDKFIHPSQRPVAYGGTGVELGKAAGHLDFMALEKDWAASKAAAAASISDTTGPNTQLSSKNNSNNANNVSKGQASILKSSSTDGSVQPGSSTVAASSSASASVAPPRKGIAGWFTRTKSAYLGDELTIRYNAATGKWDDMGSSDQAECADDSSVTKGATASGVKGLKGSQSSGDVINSKRTAPHSAPHSPVRQLQEQVAEHGMVLAIHAAHRANARRDGLKSSISSGALSLSSPSAAAGMGALNLEEGHGNYGNYAERTDSDKGIDRMLTRSTSGLSLGGMEESSVGLDAAGYQYKTASGGGGGNGERRTKLSPTLFLLVVMAYMFCLWIQTVLFTLIPVWMVIPASAGGMEYSVREVSLVLSSTAIFALIGHKLLAQRTEHILKTSPVRTLRIGCGLLLVVLLLLPSFMEIASRDSDHALSLNEAPNQSHNMPTASSIALDDIERNVKVFGRPLPYHVPISYSTFATADHHNVAYDYVQWASSKYTFHHRSILALQLPAMLLALMLCGLQLCRRASGVLLHLTLSTSFHEPSSVRRAISGCVDVGGPTLAALLFSLLYGMGLKYPLDASGFYSLSGCIIMSVYISSLFLRVQFRGDYGIMPDHKEAPSFAAIQRHGGISLDGGVEIELGDQHDGGMLSTAAYQRMNISRRGGGGGSSSSIQQVGGSGAVGGGAGGLGQIDNGSAASAAPVSALEQIFSVPTEDASLLYTPIFASYGSKLYNLKDDFKDV